MKRPLVITIIVIIIAIAVGGYLYLSKKTPEEQAAAALEESLQSATGGTLPSFVTPENLLENVPEINPIDKINPFKDGYKNPF